MIKVIVSHDVDHLYGRDHWFRDLFYPKLIVRSTGQLFCRKITVKEWLLRSISCFKKGRNCLHEVMNFDRKHGIASTFFFGVRQGLGMSYRPQEATAMVNKIRVQGFSVGLHGICYDNFNGIKQEYKAFARIYGFEPCGIRMHYVRYNDETFENLAKVGYIFDTTEFEKEKTGTQKSPYRVGNMWEFPLTIMDGYLPQKFEDAKKETLKKLQECREKNLEYITILFHDYQFCSAYQDMKNWYMWLMQYFNESKEYCFVSYKDAIEELRTKREQQRK